MEASKSQHFQEQEMETETESEDEYVEKTSKPKKEDAYDNITATMKSFPITYNISHLRSSKFFIHTCCLLYTSPSPRD